MVSQDQLEQLDSQQTQLIAQLDSAQVQLENTRVKAPFAGRVRQQVAQLGSVVGTGQSIAEIYTDQILEVTVSLTESEASLIPGLFQGATINAEIQAQFGELSDTWLGQNPTSRTGIKCPDPDDSGHHSHSGFSTQGIPLVTQCLCQCQGHGPGNGSRGDTRECAASRSSSLVGRWRHLAHSKR